MKVLRNTQDVRDQRKQAQGIESFVDIQTIRRRVATIKNRWTPEMTRSRAIEGERRRAELESLMLELLCDIPGSEDKESCDLRDFGFSLVG